MLNSIPGGTRPMRGLVLFTALLLGWASEADALSGLVVLVLTPGDTAYDRGEADEAAKAIRAEIPDAAVVISSHDLGGVDAAWGAHAVWNTLPRILSAHPDVAWLLIVESESRISGRRLSSLLATLESAGDVFAGHGLVDAEPVITHHFYGADPSEAAFEYPDWAAGVLISRSLLTRLVAAVETPRAQSVFAIDPKHEFARFVFDSTGVRLRSEVDAFCLGPPGDVVGNNDNGGCAVWFEQRAGARGSCPSRPPLTQRSIYIAVKTFSGYHRTRVVVAKRTWAATARLVEFFSDMVDPYVPTIDLGIANTERGHCAKTIAILKHAAGHEEITSDVRWVLVADDDTLVGLSRLLRVLRCYDPDSEVILGERYGYGYGASGTSGYDYPTGGAGMVFSLPAVRALVAGCACPSEDSPDDMIIGMCARRLGIPIVHVAGMHQGRSIDYARPFLRRVLPVSLHKHHDIDPYADYAAILREETDGTGWRVHSEL